MQGYGFQISNLPPKNFINSSKIKSSPGQCQTTKLKALENYWKTLMLKYLKFFKVKTFTLSSKSKHKTKGLFYRPKVIKKDVLLAVL